MQLNMSNLNTSKIKNIDKIFDEHLNLKQLDISNFDISRVENMDNFFCRM